MTLNGSIRPDVNAVLAGLKDFQRDTTEYVFRRLYADPNCVSRFLIADEVGLGKTLVARGVIAKAVDALWDIVPRIDVVYICSNQEIARQNIDRLNITADRKFQFASRATLLPVTLQQLRGNKLNFVSLTPGTSFDLRSQSGQRRERAVLYSLLQRRWGVLDGPLRNVLRGNVKRENWKAYLDWFERDLRPRLDEELEQAFYEALDQAPDLRAQYEDVAEQIGSRRKHLTDEMRKARNHLIGGLRRLLARSSLSALEPDLVILDEFQRFKYLLDDRHDAGLLAQELFDFQDVKILLLSATPYKMYTLQGEKDEDHYKDFYDTVHFLLKGEPATLQRLQSALNLYRDAIFHVTHGGHKELREAKATIEDILRQLMVRTERLAVSADRNGMLVESLVARDQVHPADLAGFVHLDRIATAIDAGDQVEYWKSAAYPLNLMDRYKLKDRFTAALIESGGELNALLKEARDYLLSWKEIQAYRAIDPGNARLRALWLDSVETGNWQLLWMPPSLPYYQPRGPYCDVHPEGCTKTLVFSAWKLVPKTIAVLLSYEAERRMLEKTDRDFNYDELTDKRRSLLRFTLSRGRLTGMPVFCLIYPCLTLARDIDPLAIPRRVMDGETPSWEAVFDAARAQVDEFLQQAVTSIQTKRGGREDERWYWAALVLLDRRFHWETVKGWLSATEENLAWSNMLDTDLTGGDDQSVEGENRFVDHVTAFTEFFRQPESLGRMPSDLADVLAFIALSGPAVTALRALLRVTPPNQDDQWSAVLASAARVGLAFRTLFNQPEVISLLQSEYPEEVYWQKTLRYCSDGNLQAVMDEYLHILYESLGLVGHNPIESVEKLGDTVRRALSLRAPSLQFDEIVPQRRGKSPIVKPRRIRCRYALHFGDERNTDDERTRGVDVRIAFNSPFRPFVLATTSIGQEGLDFHQYCHRVVHWNLPSNPVDLEQREGRVHRYKGHVIRRNLALKYGLAGVKAGKTLADPWQQIFEQAVRDRSEDANDLVPFWIYEADEDELKGKAFKIERKVPVLPLSREIGRMERLKRSLVTYRSVIGQPRQQELLEFLSAHLDEKATRDLVDSVAIDLSPPRRAIH